MKEHLISVVMPTYNREWCISDAIRSIVGQTYKKWELIVVDDGSTDDTETVMNFWRNRDKRIKYHKLKENVGIAKARNTGNQLAKGELVAVMDSDDLMLNNRLHDTNATYDGNKWDVFYSDCYMGDSFGNIMRVNPANGVLDEALDGKQEVSHLTMAYRRSVILDVPYQDSKRINDDWFLCVDLYNAGMNFFYFPMCTMILRNFPSASVSVASREQYKKDFEEYKIDKKLREENVKKRKAS